VKRSTNLSTVRKAPETILANVDTENHRTRVGRERRLKTGRRILAAVFQFVDREGVDALTIDRVAETAGLSRGALYTYATHLDDLLVRISHLVWKQVKLEQIELVGPRATPLERMSGSLRYGIIRSLGDPAIGPILFKSLAWEGAFGREMRSTLLSDLAEAERLGMIDVDSLDTAADLAMGMMTAIMRHALVRGPSSKKLSEQSVIVFRALGVTRSNAHALANMPLPKQPSLALRKKVLLAGWNDR
jgi:AcrR family transcriptional regulator